MNEMKTFIFLKGRGKLLFPLFPNQMLDNYPEFLDSYENLNWILSRLGYIFALQRETFLFVSP